MIFDDFHELYQGAVHNRYKWLRVITNCKGRKKCVKFNVVDDGKFNMYQCMYLHHAKISRIH